ncbi:O-antigen ligase family protein [Flavobacteriaceae bacterium]|nr:O-antigen ligase family protein [Flavobacteriaceae bacterium]
MNTIDKVSLYLLLIIPLIGGVNNIGDDTMYLRYIRLCLLVIVMFAVLFNFKSQAFKIPSFKKYFFYYGYLFLCFVSIFWAVQKVFAIFKLFEVIVYFILFWKITNRNNQFLFKNIFKFIEILLTITLVTALVNPTIGFNIIPNILPYQLRGTYFPLNPNDVGFLACILSCHLSWNFINGQKNTLLKILFFLFILVLSQSRIFLAVYMLFLFMALTNYKQKIGLFVLSPLFINEVYQLLLPFFLRDKSVEDLASINGRIGFWEIGINSFLENPWFGKGFYTGHRFLNEINMTDFNSSTFDNTYIDILNDNGIFGILLLLLTIILVTKKIYGVNKLLFSIWLITLIRAFVGPSFQVLHPVLPVFCALVVYAFDFKKKNV